MNGRILLLLVQSRMTATTIIHLDEVELQLLKVVVCIHLLIAVEAHIRILSVAIADTATSAIASIAVDACLQAFRVNIVAHDLQAMRKTLRMDANLSL